MLGYELNFAVQLEILQKRYEELKGKKKEGGREDSWILSYIKKINLLKEHASCSSVRFQNTTHSSKFLMFKTKTKELIFLS